MGQGLLTSGGLVFLGVGVKALIDGHWIWGTILLMSGIAMIVTAWRNWTRANAFAYDPPFLVAYARDNSRGNWGLAPGETLTFSIPPGKAPITKLVFEPLTAITGWLQIDPPEVLFLHPDQPVTCMIVSVNVGTPTRSAGYRLQKFLEQRNGGRIQVVARYTDAQGMRRRLPFTVEIIGADHRVEWVPGRVQNAEPDW